MLVYFNKKGQLLEVLTGGQTINAGDTDLKIIAYVEDVDDDTNFSNATIILTKPDLEEGSYPPMLMKSVNNFVYSEQEYGASQYFKVADNPYHVYEFDFDDITDSDGNIISLLDTSGLWRATITLIGTNTTYNVQGQLVFNVMRGIESDDETEVSIYTILNQIYSQLATKLNFNSDFFLRVREEAGLSQDIVNNPAKYALNSVVYTRDSRKFYKITNLSTGALQEIEFNLNSLIVNYLRANNISLDSHWTIKINPSGQIGFYYDNVLVSQIISADIVAATDEKTLVNKKYVDAIASSIDENKQDKLVSGVNIKTIAGKTILGSGNVALNKSDVGLGNVDNTSDLNKPISTATQNALNILDNKIGDEKSRAEIAEGALDGKIDAHIDNENNPHNVTKSQVGLSNVDNVKQYPYSSGVSLANDLSAETNARQQADNGLQGDIDTINSKIPNQASASNQLADKDFVNSTVNSLAAFYITKNAQGDPFATYAELASATVFYSGGEVRVPTRNDYCIVVDDENHDHASCRYIYQGNQWEFQFVINETPFTSEQLAAINSGITAALVAQIGTNQSNISAIQGNYVTTNTNQTITSEKTFVGDLKFQGNGTSTIGQITTTNYAVKIGYGGVNHITIGGNNFYTNVADYDLGSNSNKWRDLYLSRNLTDGTNSISVANIVSKTTTIAGIALSSNISAQALTDALVFMNNTTDLDYVMED